MSKGHTVFAYVTIEDVENLSIDNLIKKLAEAKVKIFEDQGEEYSIDPSDYSISICYKRPENEKEKEFRLKQENGIKIQKQYQLKELLKEFGFDHAGNGRWTGPVW